jgi:DNA-directed RNA polymerase
MSIKNPDINDNVYFDHAQDFRGELFFMQLYFNEQQEALKNSQLTKKTIRKIKSNLKELVCEILYEYQIAKEDNKLPKEFRSSN